MFDIFTYKGVRLLITLAILLSLSVILNFILFKTLSNKNEQIDVKNNKVSELEMLKEKLSLEIDKNKEIYNLDRKSLISENEHLKTKLKQADRKLANFSKEQSDYYAQMDNVHNFSKEMTPTEFLEIREGVLNRSSGVHDFTGIYILENKTHDKFYVGQSISVFKRAGSHFTGQGNKDIYEDYMSGDIWTVRLVSLANSGFKSINALEKHFIEYHHSTYNGYNKTVGNAN